MHLKGILYIFKEFYHTMNYFMNLLQMIIGRYSNLFCPYKTIDLFEYNQINTFYYQRADWTDPKKVEILEIYISLLVHFRIEMSIISLSCKITDRY